jgi:hypothetical protein
MRTAIDCAVFRNHFLLTSKRFNWLLWVGSCHWLSDGKVRFQPLGDFYGRRTGVQREQTSANNGGGLPQAMSGRSLMVVNLKTMARRIESA